MLRFGFSFLSGARGIFARAHGVSAGARGVLALAGCLLTLAGCASADPHALAREDDRRYRTAVFTWLVEHEPSAVVAWHIPVATVGALLPASRISAAATTKVCAQAASSHALLLLVGPRSATRDRADAEDCGFALERDAGAIVVAPR